MDPIKAVIFDESELKNRENVYSSCTFWHFWLIRVPIQERIFAIFRRLCNIQEKLFIQFSLQWGQISFFFQCKTANSFCSKIIDSSRVRTTAFSSSRIGVRVCVVPIIFTIYL